MLLLLPRTSAAASATSNTSTTTTATVTHWKIVYRKIIGIYRNFDAKLLNSFFATVSEVFWELL